MNEINVSSTQQTQKKCQQQVTPELTKRYFAIVGEIEKLEYGPVQKSHPCTRKQESVRVLLLNASVVMNAIALVVLITLQLMTVLADVEREKVKNLRLLPVTTK